MNIEETLAYSEGYASGIDLAAEVTQDVWEEDVNDPKVHIGITVSAYQYLAGMYMQNHLAAPPNLRIQRTRALFDGFCQGVLERGQREDMAFIEPGYFGDTVFYLRRNGDKWEGRVFNGGDCPWHPRSEAPFALMNTPSELADAVFHYGPYSSHSAMDEEQGAA
jgi:hypothetical protein